MKYEHRRSRFDTPWLATLAVASMLAADISVAAEIYDPPRYCDAAALRVDAQLRAIEFHDPELGVAVGAHGAIVLTEDGGKSWQVVESSVAFQLDDVAWLNDRQVVAVGGVYDPITGISRGVVVFSTDGGRRWWRAADQELPRLRSIRIRADDGAMVAAGDWSCVSLEREYESRDGGRTWNSSAGLDGPVTIKPELTSHDLLAWVKATRIPVAIRDAVGTSSGAIWAVGDHGVILKRDSEQDAWNVSRGVGNQTGVLMISGEPTSVAWPLLGREALEAGNRVALVTLQQQYSRQSDSTSSSLDLVRQAAAAVGVSSVDASDVASQDVRQQASDWMAIHHPAVVVIDQSLAQQTRTAYAEAAIAFGAQRVLGYSFQSRGASGSAMLHHSAMLPRTGILASDLWQDAFRIVSPADSRVHSISLRSLYNTGSAKVRGDTVASGLRLKGGQTLDAKTEPASRRQLQISQARLNHEKQIDSLIRNSHSENDFAIALKGLLDQTAKSDQQRLAWSIFQQLAVADPMPADVSGFQEAILAEFQSRFRGSSLAWYASLRVQAIRNSDEWRRLRLAVANSPIQSAVRTASAEIVAVSPFQVDTSQVRQASASVPLKIVDMTPVDATPQTTSGDFIDLNWEFHPLALVTREAARSRGDDNQLQTPGGISANLRRLLESNQGAWSELLRKQGPQVVASHPTETPPRLDGRIDDGCWQAALPRTGTEQRVWCAHDEQFLYLAIATPEDLFRDDAELPASQQVRDRDLSPVDRIQVSIDTDLDLLTSCNFQFSRGGRTHDSIDGYPQWQPTWYVASQQSGGFVVTELAILRRDLVDLPLVAGQSWFVKAKTMAAGEPSFFQCMPRPSDWKRIVFY